MKFLLASLFLAGVFSSPLVFASGLQCARSASGNETSSHQVKLDPVHPQVNHARLAEFAKKKSLPVFLISTPAGKNVPVILLSKQTMETWSTILLEQTLGLNQSLNHGSTANHGYVRLPGRALYGRSEQMAGKLFEDSAPDAALIDLFSTGQAVEQLIHGSGYHWKSFAEFIGRRSGKTVHIEQAFALSKEDQIRMWLYQEIKRSSIVRIQYMFETLNNDWIVQQRRVLQQDEGFRYKRCGEHCNNSRVGTMALIHAAEMRDRVKHLLNNDTNAVFNRPETHRFLDDAKKKLLYSDWRNADSMHPDLLNDDHFIGLMAGHLNPWLSREQQVDALSYLLAINVFEEAAVVKDKYEMNEEIAMTLDNPKISALVIYSDLPDSVDRFREANFEHFGANGSGFSASWPGLHARPIP